VILPTSGPINNGLGAGQATSPIKCAIGRPPDAIGLLSDRDHDRLHAPEDA
jgi:hypothetical protein